MPVTSKTAPKNKLGIMLKTLYEFITLYFLFKILFLAPTVLTLIEMKGAKLEPQKRVHSPQLAAGLASESENSKLPYGRSSPQLAAGSFNKDLLDEF